MVLVFVVVRLHRPMDIRWGADTNFLCVCVCVDVCVYFLYILLLT